MIAIDTENTFWNKGNPFDERNFNVCISYAFRNEAGEIEAGVLFDEERERLKALLELHEEAVFFNAKYDLHWLRKLRFDLGDKRIWCGQVFAFLHGRQSEAFPSLDDTATRYGLGSKIDIVATEYWDKGINTCDIPRQILSDYAVQDARLTLRLVEEQKKLVKPHQRTLVSLSMQDLVVLEEMEWNGLYYNKNKSLDKAKDLETEISSIQTKLNLYHNIPSFNWGSSDHLSALLYGGEVTETVKEPDGTYKTGAKKGQIKYKNVEKVYQLPRIYKPIKGSELKKENKWSVEEQYLLQLKGDDSLITGILRIKELEKLRSTYLLGIPKLCDSMNWPAGYVHGQFNQCVARTGRLSSSKPNLQNLSEHALEYFETRWNHNTSSLTT